GTPIRRATVAAPADVDTAIGTRRQARTTEGEGGSDDVAADLAELAVRSAGRAEGVERAHRGRPVRGPEVGIASRIRPFEGVAVPASPRCHRTAAQRTVPPYRMSAPGIVLRARSATRRIGVARS